MNFKQKTELVTQIFKQYKYSKIQLKMIETEMQLIVKEEGELYENTKHKQKHSEMLVMFVDEIVNLFDDDGKSFIKQDFLEIESKSWWQKYYSRTTYYRLKNQILDELIFYFKDCRF